MAKGPSMLLAVGKHAGPFIFFPSLALSSGNQTVDRVNFLQGGSREGRYSIGIAGMPDAAPCRLGTAGQGTRETGQDSGPAGGRVPRSAVK